MPIPEFFKLLLKTKLLRYLGQQPAVPLLGGEVLADSSQIEHGDSDARLAEAGSRPDHERGLAHLAGGQHVAEPPPRQARGQIAIGPAGDVTERVAAQRTARDIEGIVDSRLNSLHSRCLP